jgi:hypothetical protein
MERTAPRSAQTGGIRTLLTRHGGASSLRILNRGLSHLVQNAHVGIASVSIGRDLRAAQPYTVAPSLFARVAAHLMHPTVHNRPASDQTTKPSVDARGYSQISTPAAYSASAQSSTGFQMGTRYCSLGAVASLVVQRHLRLQRSLVRRAAFSHRSRST